MSYFEGEAAAATCSVGADILEETSQPWRISNIPRILVSVSIVGSTAKGDCKFDVIAGQKLVGSLYNSQAGASVVANKDDEKMIGAYVAASTPIQLECVDAADTQIVRFGFRFKRFTRRRFSRRNYRYRRRY